MATAPIPQVSLDRFETEYRDRHLIHAAVDWWAARKHFPSNALNRPESVWCVIDFHNGVAGSVRPAAAGLPPLGNDSPGWP
jgi:hypothetical protein